MSSNFKEILKNYNAKHHRRKLRSALKRKYRNINNNRPDKERIDLTKSTKSKYTNRIVQQKISVGKTLSVTEDPENIVKLINTIENLKTKNKYITNILLDLANISKIDIGAISILLAKVNQISLGKKRIKFSGTFPILKECLYIFKESGFLDYMRDMSGRKYSKQSDNYLVRIGKDKTDNEKVGIQIKKAMKFLTDEENHFPPVFSMIQEMCSNSVEHSSKKNKNWLLGVNYSEEDQVLNRHVVFTMTDVGEGILKTLKRKFRVRISELMENPKDPDVLYRAFEKKYDSVTNEENRNKGLPLILDRCKKKYVKDLIVVSNNVYLDMSSPKSSKTLNLNFGGTFYCWKIDLNCIELWNQASIN